MCTAMPARSQISMDSMTPSRGGSLMPTRPTNTRSSSTLSLFTPGGGKQAHVSHALPDQKE